MAKKGFFSDVDWLKVAFLTGVIVAINMICGWLNLQITGGWIVEVISTGVKLAVGFSLYKLISKKK